MPWVLLVLAIVASVVNSLDSNFKAEFGKDQSGVGWAILLYFLWRIFTPALLFVLSAVTWICGQSCPT